MVLGIPLQQYKSGYADNRFAFPQYFRKRLRSCCVREARLKLRESQPLTQLLLDLIAYAHSPCSGPVASEPGLADTRRYRYPALGEHPPCHDSWICVSREMLPDTAAPAPLQVGSILETALDTHAALGLQPPLGYPVRYQDGRLSLPKNSAKQKRRWMVLRIANEELYNTLPNSK